MENSKVNKPTQVMMFALISILFFGFTVHVYDVRSSVRLNLSKPSLPKPVNSPSSIVSPISTRVPPQNSLGGRKVNEITQVKAGSKYTSPGGRAAFVVPSDVYIRAYADDIEEFPTIQVTNYDQAKAIGGGFPAGQWKVEMLALSRESSDWIKINNLIDATVASSNFKFAGLTAIKTPQLMTDGEIISSEQFYSYTLRTHDGKLLMWTLYPYNVDKRILDKILESLNIN